MKRQDRDEFIKVPDFSNELKIMHDDDAITICRRLCNSLKLSGNREKDEEFVMENICRVLSKNGTKTFPF